MFEHVSASSVNAKAGDDEMRNWKKFFFFKTLLLSHLQRIIKMKGLLIGRAECAVSNEIPSENPFKSP